MGTVPFDLPYKLYKLWGITMKNSNETNTDYRQMTNMLTEERTYEFGQLTLITEPIFKEKSIDTLGSVLLRLITSTL